MTLANTDETDVEVYVEKDNSKFEYKGRLKSSTLAVNIDDDYAVWVLMIPECPRGSYSGFIAKPSLREVEDEDCSETAGSKALPIVLIASVITA